VAEACPSAVALQPLLKRRREDCKPPERKCARGLDEGNSPNESQDNTHGDTDGIADGNTDCSQDGEGNGDQSSDGSDYEKPLKLTCVDPGCDHVGDIQYTNRELHKTGALDDFSSQPVSEDDSE